MSATQSAHYIVDESGALHDGNTWGMGNTDRGIPNRWRVQHGFVPTFQGVMRWKVLAPGAVLPVARFATWREAQDYADRMARTREVVLPRLAPRGEVTVSAIWGFDSPVVHYIDASGQTVQGTPADLTRHATALLALAEQEEHE